MRWRCATVLAAAATRLLAAGTPAGADTLPAFFYRPSAVGSAAQFNPLSSFVNYAWDSVQVRRSFDDDDFGSRGDTVVDHLVDPWHAIEKEGGFGAFVNRQVFPLPGEDLGETPEALPNYALHLIGGGMVYRKNAEWLAAHGYPWPRTLAAASQMSAELLQEIFEKRATDADDEVADFWLFRPAGILLFTFDPVARFFAETMRLAEWPHQPMIDVARGDLTNVAENYVVRPALFGGDRHVPFVYFGLNPLFGASHRVDRLGRRDAISWGAGVAIVKADRTELVVRPSGGLFWDRDDSLLASLLVNTTDALRVRLNVYPGVLTAPHWWSPGVYLGVQDDGTVVIGATVTVTPVGLAGFVH